MNFQGAGLSIETGAYFLMNRCTIAYNSVTNVAWPMSTTSSGMVLDCNLVRLTSGCNATIASTQFLSNQIETCSAYLPGREHGPGEAVGAAMALTSEVSWNFVTVENSYFYDNGTTIHHITQNRPTVINH
jgi:hypothetical protein